MDLYRDLILDHYKNPRNFGHLKSPDVVVEDHNVSCGDRIVIELLIAYHLSLITIRDIRFSGEGCAISQASASLLTEMIKNMPVVKIKKLALGDIEKMLGTKLTPSRVKCALLPLEVLHKALINR